MVSIPIWAAFLFWYAFGVGSGVFLLAAFVLWAKRRIDAELARSARDARHGPPLRGGNDGARNG